MKKTIHTILGNLKVSSGFNIYIDITAACNAQCPFCIAPVIGRRDGPGFWDGVDFALRLAHHTDGTIQIVGGEPTISKRLSAFLDRVKSQNVRRIVLNTNGAHLEQENLVLMKKSGITHINISRHHFDEVKNQSIMIQKPPFLNEALAKTIGKIIRLGIDIRLNCNLISGEIDTLEEMNKFMDWGMLFGCKTYSFSQLFPLGLFDFQVPPIPGYTEAHQVDLVPIVDRLDRDSGFLATLVTRMTPLLLSEVKGGEDLVKNCA